MVYVVGGRMNNKEKEKTGLIIEDKSCKKKGNTEDNRVCSVCEKVVYKFLCSQCHNDNYARYCGKECQKQAWRYHKLSCFPIPNDLYKESQDNSLLRKGIKLNLFNHFQSMDSRKKAYEAYCMQSDDHETSGNRLTEYENARYLIYKGIIEIILKGNYEDYSKRNAIHPLIMEGCKVLVKQIPSPFDNKEDFLWMFMPKPFISIVHKHNNVVSL